MSRLTAHQPTFAPYLGTLAKIDASDAFVLYDDVQAEDSGWENRVMIRGTSGPLMLTVPIHRDREAKIKDIRIANQGPWARKHYRSWEMNYSKAPFWPKYGPILADIYLTKWELLVDLNVAILEILMAELECSRPIKRLSDLGLTSSKSQLVLDMCLAMGADEYVFGPCGRAYANVAEFLAAGAKPLFQVFTAPDNPPLSTFDSLLRVGPEETRALMLAGGRIEE